MTVSLVSLLQRVPVSNKPSVETELAVNTMLLTNDISKLKSLITLSLLKHFTRAVALLL